MFKDYKIVSVTPAGRKKYLEILVPHLLAQRDIIDKHVFWVNTTVPEDIAYLEEITDQYPDFFSLHRMEDSRADVQGTWRNILIYQFFQKYQDEDTIYIRFDDDICYIHPDAVKNLVNYRIQHPEAFLVYPLIINNAVCTSMLQTSGKIDQKYGVYPFECLSIAWARGDVAESVHEQFLSALSAGKADDFKLTDKIFWRYHRVSINCICWFGKDFKQFNGEVGGDEENWLSVEKPMREGRPNQMCGSAIVSHFAFHTQREYLESNTNLLQRYRKIAMELE